MKRKRPELLLAAAALLVCAGVLVATSVSQGRNAAAAGAPTEVQAVVNPFEQNEQAATGGYEEAGSYAIGYTGVIVYPPQAGAPAQMPTESGSPSAQSSGPSRSDAQPEYSEPPAVYAEPPMEYAQPPTQPAQTQPPAQLPAQPAATAPKAPAQPQVVNINSANQAQLETLPGIGPVKAQAILDWRAAHGRFTDVYQLLEVKGIGEKTMANLLPYVVI